MTSESIPFVDMGARIRPIRDELVAACARVIDSNVFVMGPETAQLEDEFAKFCRVPHAVAVANGTAALHLALIAAGVGPGDEVITVANTFIATVEAIAAVGATPVFVDIEPETRLMDSQACARAVTPRTRAIIPVHLYGLMCDMDAVNAIAARHHLAVIEDACQAHGATFRGLAAGAWGDFGCFSFYPGKNIGATGEGGMVVARTADGAARVRRLRNHGERQRYDHAELAFNMRISELQAAAVRVQLRRADQWNAARREVANWYRSALADLPLQVPITLPDRVHVFHLYAVEVEQRDDVRQALADAGIGTGIHYPIPLHRQEACRALHVPEGALPATDRSARRLLSLPMFPELRHDQVERVSAALHRITGSSRTGMVDSASPVMTTAGGRSP